MEMEDFFHREIYLVKIILNMQSEILILLWQIRFININISSKNIRKINWVKLIR